MNFSEILTEILKNKNIVGAISSSVLIILFGFYLRRKEIFKDSTAKNFNRCDSISLITSTSF